MADWEIEIDKKKKLSIDEAKFIFEQAEKQLKDTIDTSTLIIGRNTILITAISGVFITFLGIAVTKFETTQFDSIFFTCILCAVYLFWIGIDVLKNIDATSYLILADLPKNYFHDIYFEGNPPEKVRLLWYYIKDIQEYQGRIIENKEKNETRWSIYSTSLKRVIYTPLIFALFYIVVKIILLLISLHLHLS